MKTILLHNCTGFKDKFFKVAINGKKHVMRHQFLNIHVADDKPFDVKVKYFGSSSPLYTFEPKENLSLQILPNRQLMKTSLVLFIAGIVLTFAIVYFYKEIPLITIIPLLFMLIHQIIRRKSFFVIREVNAEKIQGKRTKFSLSNFPDIFYRMLL